MLLHLLYTIKVFCSSTKYIHFIIYIYTYICHILQVVFLLLWPCSNPKTQKTVPADGHQAKELP